jgi:N-methylhydantoinase A/oxoprolinase/acetone carboxylase beta subunit
MATRLGVDGGGTFTDLTIERTKNSPSGLAGVRPGRHAVS